MLIERCLIGPRQWCLMVMSMSMRMVVVVVMMNRMIMRLVLARVWV